MPKPEHLKYCEEQPLCPGCAYDRAVEDTLAAVHNALGEVVGVIRRTQPETADIEVRDITLIVPTTSFIANVRECIK